MSHRYNSSISVLDPDGEWVSPNAPLLDTDVHPDDRYHTVQQGERLDLIAYKYLQDAKLWWVIAAYNNIFWFQDIEVGDVLRVPSFEHTYLDLLR